MPELRSPKQRREQLARSLRGQGRSWVDIAEVLRQRYRLNARVAFRYAHGWSQRQAADEWNRRWPDELKTFKMFSYWEQWPSNTGHAPSFDNFSKLAQLYECSVSDLLVDLPDFRHLDSASTPPVASNAPAARQGSPHVVVPGSPSAPTPAVGLQLRDDSAALQLPYRGDAQVPVPRVVRALEVIQQAAVCDSVMLEDLNTVVEHYKRTFRSTPPEELYNEILGIRIHAGTLLDGRLVANNRSDLVVVTGLLSNLLALVTHDLHDRAASLVWCADAERRSREASHPELGGWAAHTRVLMSFYDGRALEAVTHAQRGQALAPLGTVAHTKLVAQEMRAWALIGNSDKVSNTRWRAEQAIAKLPPGTPTHGAFSISLADDPPYTATSLLLLGRYKEAVEASERVIATFYGSGEGCGKHPSGFARTHLILALALAGLGKLDEAYAAGSVALAAHRLDWPVAVLAGKLNRTLMRDFTDTPEADAYHERYVAAMQQNPPVGGQLSAPTPLHHDHG